MTPPHPLRVCQVVASINRDVGGPAVSVPALASALAAEGMDSHLMTLDYPGVGPMEPAPGATVHSVPANWPARNLRGWSRPLRAELNRLAGGGMDVIHGHGVWMFPNLYARQTAVRSGIPLVISPRGMLEQWSLGRSRAKKFLVWHAFENENLRAATMFHATSAAELESLRRLRLRQPVAVIPNGVELPDLAATPPRALPEGKFPALAGKRWLLFLSRLHPKKGVGELLQAWAQLAPRFPDWHLILAGPDRENFGDALKRQAGAAGIAAQVTFTGMLAGADKCALLGNADLFVLPTHSENFGIVIAESLAHGVPVVTTQAAPWAELETARCGWWIPDNGSALIESLRSAMRSSAAERSQMGARGRQLVETRYSWPSAGRQFAAAYAWLRGRGPKPECVS